MLQIIGKAGLVENTAATTEVHRFPGIKKVIYNRILYLSNFADKFMYNFVYPIC